jgi:hypothetical protein
MIAAAVAILIGVYVAATGRGGELAYEVADHAPLDLGPVSATDIAMLRPPTAIWGYNVDVTDEALERIARAVRERDVTIAYLQSRLADLAPQTASLRPSAGTAPLRPSAETASLRPAAETGPLRASAETGSLRPSAETGSLHPSAETGSLRPSAETGSLRPSAETGSLRPSAETAPLGPVAETAPLRPSAGTTSAEPPGPPGEAAGDDDALPPEEHPW